MPIMSGARYLAETLASYEVSHVFMVPAVLRRSLAEMERRTDIARIQAHGEKSAAYMADGYARATGKPGVCMAQVVGAMNLAAGLRDAWLAHSPVIAMTGGRLPATKFRGVYQEIDDVPSFEAVTKWNATLDDVSRFPDMLRQAFRVATSGRPGPVHLQFQGNEGQLDTQEADLELIHDADFLSVPAFRPQPESRRIDQALDRIRRAERPVLVAGGGVRASGAHRELQTLAERLGIPVATSLNAKDALTGEHPLSVGVVGTYSRESANRVVSEADLVIFVGTSTGGMTTHFWAVPPIGTAAIQIDIEPEALGRNYPLEVGILGDARSTLAAMVAGCEADESADRHAWTDRSRQIVSEWRGKYANLIEADSTPMRPERICKELTEHMPDDAIVVVDTGHSGMWMGGMFDLSKPTQSYIRSAGHLGWAFPAGLGAKCACPDRPVLTFTGDSGFWYHIGELETAVRWRINAVTLVNNNASGNQSKLGFDRAYGGQQTEKAGELWKLNEVNFANVAESMGALGIRVERPSELSGALQQAFQAERPVVIDCASDIEAMAPLAWVPA